MKQVSTTGEYVSLFQPIQIGSLTIKNRFVMPPMLSASNVTDHCFSDEAIAYYAARAQGGFGLLITEFLCVDETGLGCDTEIGIWNDRFIPSLARLTEAIHSKEGRIFAQLHHQGILAVCSDIHTQPVGPSAIMSLSSMDPPRELSNAEVYALAGRFVDAAERAQKAGFDGVEIHAAHGYLLCQFLSTYFNKRSDEFGGSYENRFRMIRLIIAGIRERCGASYPISFRFSTDNFLDGGAIPHDSLIYAKLAEQAGVDCIHVSTGGAGGNVVTPYTYRPGFNIENIAKIKQNVSVPVIGVGRINEPALADLYVQMGLLDMVSLGRQSICDPNFPNKTRDGCAQEIIPCVGCLQRCFFTPGYDETDTGISCMLNPFSGKELSWKIEPAKQQKCIAIAGGGPAGLMAAWVLAKRGHEVHVYEKKSVLGGAFRLAAVPPRKHDFARVIHSYASLGKRYGVNYHLNAEMTPEVLRERKFDVLIVATGSKPLLPPIPGIEDPSLIKANDVLSGENPVVHSNVLILGSGLVGCELAEFLTLYDNQVSVVEMQPEFAKEGAPIPRSALLDSMKHRNIRLFPGTKVTQIHSDGVEAVCGDQTLEIRDFDKVILALGSRNLDELSQTAADCVPEVYVVGDARRARDARHAIYEAAHLAIQI